MDIRTKYDLYTSPSRWGRMVLVPRGGRPLQDDDDWVHVPWTRRSYQRALGQSREGGLPVLVQREKTIEKGGDYYVAPPKPRRGFREEEDPGKGLGKRTACAVVRWLQAYGETRYRPEEIMPFELFERKVEVCAQALAGAFWIAGCGHTAAGLVVDLDKTDIVGANAYDMASGLGEDGSLINYRGQPQKVKHLHLGQLALHGEFSSMMKASAEHAWSGHSEVWLGKRREYKGIVLVGQDKSRKREWRRLAEEYSIPVLSFHMLQISSGSGT